MSGSGCALTSGDRSPDRLSSDACLSCHTRHGSFDHSHPSQIQYASAVAQGMNGLRGEADVLARGVKLVEGRVECVMSVRPMK